MKSNNLHHLLPILAVIILSFGCVSLKDNHSDKISKDVNTNTIDKENKRSIYREAIKIIDNMVIDTLDDSHKTFIKEYTYRASDDDSKNSARVKALQQLKINVSEEIGVYIESYFEINTQETNSTFNQLVTSEIKSLSAGITKTNIIQEKWDGKEYYVKASVSINPDSVARGISEALKTRVTEKEVQRLEEILNDQSDILKHSTLKSKELQKKVATQAILNEAKNKELEITKKQLEEARSLLLKATQEHTKIQSELEQIRVAIDQSTKNALNNILLGMTPDEVVQVAGPPRSTYLHYTTMGAWIYGRLWVRFEGGVVGCILDELPTFLCSAYRSDYRQHLIK